MIFNHRSCQYGLFYVIITIPTMKEDVNTKPSIVLFSLFVWLVKLRLLALQLTNYVQNSFPELPWVHLTYRNAQVQT